MAVDKVKPLGIETAIDGTQMLPLPTELDPDEDYIAVKGVAFENLDTHLSEKVGGILKFTIPDCSYAPTFLANGDLDFYEVFEGATQITANRRLRTDMTYSSGLPATEAVKFFDPSDGTTVLRTITITYTFSGAGVLTNVVEVTT